MEGTYSLNSGEFLLWIRGNAFHYNTLQTFATNASVDQTQQTWYVRLEGLQPVPATFRRFSVIVYHTGNPMQMIPLAGSGEDVTVN